ncbi:unnamed protein product [Caenorhabditis auriculariae]|uniref:Uncharacterized protein n=1 Tax=Caenorhabditis auriculariae TaxID=2777116 RepID=A0A8S1H9R9_9PELO|nr:unnamed protein product [Caenorhabditis auriculariae]
MRNNQAEPQVEAENQVELTVTSTGFKEHLYSVMEFDEEPQAKTDVERISISIVTKHGRFRRAIPRMPIALAVFCCFCNVFIPGLGTFLSALSILCCADPRGGSKLNSMGINLLAALLQLLTCPLVVGFVWSVIWGVLFIQIARKWFISDIDSRYHALDCCVCSRW